MKYSTFRSEPPNKAVKSKPMFFAVIHLMWHAMTRQKMRCLKS